MGVSVNEIFRCPHRALLDEAAPDHWVKWPYAWPFDVKPPRVCSECDGVHPDDAMALLVDGWTVEVSDMRGRLFMHAPETKGIQPIVEIYLAHWTREQVTRADEIVRGQRAFMFDMPAYAVQ